MNINSLSGILPTSVFNQIPSLAEKFQVNTILRLSHLLAQASHESGDFNIKIENLNYSKEGLMAVFPKYFTPEQALQYSRQPEKIANKVYALRMGNGDEKSGDGYKFRGRGFIQLTGKSNYMEFDKMVPENIIENPNLVADKYALFSAGWFWDRNKLNTIADFGPTTDIITKITKVVNGGTNGLNDRIEKFNKYYKILSSEA